MQICKRIFLFSLIFSACVTGGFSQNSMSMPAMPSINVSDGPGMPRISAPTLGTKFYTPGNVYTNISNKKIDSRKETSVEKNVQASDSTALEEQIKSILGAGTSDRLTASDVAGLGNEGIFGGIYGLLGSNATLVSNKYHSGSSSDLLLQNVMTQLEELKKESKKGGDANTQLKKTNFPVAVAAGREKHEYNPAILRFYVNGYNILDTMRTVYFSKKENDGSFLLTGDRKYTSDNKSREETFYLLFRADGNCGTSAGYDVEPQVIQDYKNEFSFLYQLTKKPLLKAEKTGNLVSVKYVSEDWNMDLLLDIGDDE